MAKSYSQGPIENSLRKCTDGFCLLMFIFMSIILFSLTVYTCVDKGIQNITIPTDSDDRLCGIDPLTKDYPYLYFVSPHPESIQRRVCVSQCPKSSQQTTLKCVTNSKVPGCVSLVTANFSREIDVEIYPKQLFLNRLCLPQPKFMRDSIFHFLNITIPQQKITQLQQNWKVIVLSIPAAIIITMLLLILVRFTACTSIYILIFFSIGCFLLLGYFLCASSLNLQPQAMIFKMPAHIVYKIGAGICVLIGLIISTAFCCFRKRINIATKMIKTSARFVNQHGYLIFISVFKFVFTVVFLVLWVIQLWGLLKFKQLIWQNLKINVNENQDKMIEIGIVSFHVFYLLWGFFFISQSGSFIVSGSVANWYFKKDSIFCSAVGRYMEYHSGSVCAGSFYLAIFGFIKLLYEWLKSDSDSQNSIMKNIRKCCDCLCYVCMNYIFSIMNRGAYAFINISGQSYCESAFKVLGLRVAQPVLSGVMMFLQIIFSMILRLQVVAITVLTAYLVLKNVQPYKSETTDFVATLVAIGILAAIISQLFVSIYVQAADSVAVCFLVDKQDGQSLNCPEQLKDYMEQTRANDGNL